MLQCDPSRLFQCICFINSVLGELHLWKTNVMYMITVWNKEKRRSNSVVITISWFHLSIPEGYWVQHTQEMQLHGSVRASEWSQILAVTSVGLRKSKVSTLTSIEYKLDFAQKNLDSISRLTIHWLQSLQAAPQDCYRTLVPNFNETEKWVQRYQT